MKCYYQMNTRCEVSRINFTNLLTFLAFKADLIDATDHKHLTDLNATELARQITLTDHKMLTQISQLEFINSLWRHKEAKTLCPNHTAFVDRFNVINLWVVTEIVSQPNVKRRADIVKQVWFASMYYCYYSQQNVCFCFFDNLFIVSQFIRIAGHLLHLKNFNSLFAIISGLGSVEVSRLKATWERVDVKHEDAFKEMEKLMDPSRNMSRYRNLLVRCASCNMNL